MCIKTCKVLFHILNFVHFIFKLEGGAVIWERILVGLLLYLLLTYGLFCHLT